MRRILTLSAVAALLIAGAIAVNPGVLVPVFANPSPHNSGGGAAGGVVPNGAVGEVVTLAATLGNTQVLQGGDGSLLLELTVTGQEREKVLAGNRLPMNLAIVIDRSGSMEASNKIGHARKAAEFLVGQLLPDDHVALIAYSDGAATLFASQPVGDGVEVRQAIRNLTTYGGTNLHSGMQAGGQEVLRHHFERQHVNRVILLSDGLANQGISDTASLSRIAANWREKGVAITAMGVGADFNEDLMVNLAEYSGGNYHYIESPTQLASIFERELTELVATVAQTASVSLTLAEGTTCEDVPGYRFEQDGNVVRIPLGDVPAGQTRRIVARLRVPTDEAGDLPVAQAALNYIAGEDGTAYGFEAPMLSVLRTPDSREVQANTNMAVQEKNERIVAAEAAEHAMSLFKAGRRDEARQVVTDQIAASKSFNEVAQSEDLDAQLAEMEALDAEMDEAVATSAPLPATVVKKAKESSYRYKK